MILLKNVIIINLNIILHSYQLHEYNDENRCCGLQTYSNGSTSEKGYCQMWCYILTDLILKYKEIRTEEIINRYIDNKSLPQSKIKRRLKEIIRGFYFKSRNDIYLLEGISSIYRSIDEIDRGEPTDEILNFVFEKTKL